MAGAQTEITPTDPSVPTRSQKFAVIDYFATCLSRWIVYPTHGVTSQPTLIIPVSLTVKINFILNNLTEYLCALNIE